MEEQKKDLCEVLKNFDLNSLAIKELYIDFYFQRNWRPAYIINSKDSNQFDLTFIYTKEQIKTIENITTNNLSFFGSYEYNQKFYNRSDFLNEYFHKLTPEEILNSINIKLKNFNIPVNKISNRKIQNNNINQPKFTLQDKNGKSIDFTGFYLYQFLSGYLVDSFIYLTNDFGKIINSTPQLCLTLLDIFIYVGETLKTNIKKIKEVTFNRKLILISPLHSTIISFKSLLEPFLFFYNYNFNQHLELATRIKKISNIIYQIIISCIESNDIPYFLLKYIIQIVSCPEVHQYIDNFNKRDVYRTFHNHIGNLSENELKNIRELHLIKNTCATIVYSIFRKNLDTLVNDSYYSFLVCCLKSKSLEKKMNALNEISDIINELPNSEKINKSFYDFIDKNKILDIFFDENIHDEVIKRSINLFKYLAYYDKLSDDVIEKLIKKQDKELFKKLLCEICSDLPKNKKDILFKRLTENIKFENNNDNIDYVTKLSEACFELYTTIEQNKNYYGLELLFNYIIKDFNDKLKYNENNVDQAIESFDHIIRRNTHLSTEDCFVFIDKLFDNIKSNTKHNSVIQSLKLLRKLFNRVGKHKDIIEFSKNLDKKYGILSLMIDDLVRYIDLLPKNNNPIDKDTIFEGIYPHNITIDQRLQLIFYFFHKEMKNYGITIQGKKHIEKIYQLLKPEKLHNELIKFYEILTNNLPYIENSVLLDFYKDILQNNSEFDVSKFSDNESINLVIDIFRRVNINSKIFLHDGRNFRVAGEKIEGFDMIFDILTKNPNINVQKKVANLLSETCLYLKDYQSDFIINYWKIFFDKINQQLDYINKSHDTIALNGIIKLINLIYSFNQNGPIPDKKDVHATEEPTEFYHFFNTKSKKEYRLKANPNDNLIELRWKLGYYYDIPVNNVCFIDTNNKCYNINDDFKKFFDLFPPEKFCIEARPYIYVKVSETPGLIYKFKENPKTLIEENEKLFNLLIDNLYVDKNGNLVDDETKQIIWNIISKLPKNFYFENKVKKYGKDQPINEKELKEIFNIKEIYILTYSLQCINFYILNTNQTANNKTEFLNNFIKIQHGDKLIYDILLNINIDPKNCTPIQIECLNVFIDLLNTIEISKEKIDMNQTQNGAETSISTNGSTNVNNIIDKIGINNLLKKLFEIISDLLELNYEKYKSNVMYSHENNDENINIDNDINSTISKLIDNILSFIEDITKNRTPCLEFLFNNSELFKKIFIYDYITCETDDSRNKINKFLTKKFHEKNNHIKNYLQITLSVDLFNYLVNNDVAGKYFHAFSEIMTEYFENNNETFESQYIDQAKKIIDLILEYLKKESDKRKIEEDNYNKNQENLINGIINLLTNILKINPKELVEYILNKINILELFLNKCILRKCTEKPLETKYAICRTNQSQESVFNLIIFLLKNNETKNGQDLLLMIIDELNKYHSLGFWKTNSSKDWDLDFRDIPKGKYIGLKNMTYTCYLNSIIQQLFMIPILRETILNINNTSKNNVLYQLQLLFSALKIYEFAFYDPKTFVVANRLDIYEQKDADEFYGYLIDKIENDIKNLFSNEKENKKNDLNEKDKNYKYKNIFSFFFGIKVVDELKFVDCGHKRYNEFFYNSIQLEIKGLSNLYESLQNYCKTEVMDGENQINCEECNTKRKCHKHLTFKNLPNILVIALKRFEFDYNTMLKYKLNDYFEFPFELDMKEFLMEDHSETNTEYELMGITIHYGVADFGHYYDIIKGKDNKWYKFNDISVTEFKEEDIPHEAFGDKNIVEEDELYKEKESEKNNAYILIYKKKNFNVESVEQLSINSNIKNDLALPPYNKFSHINNDIINEINIKLYKAWTVKNIISSSYQSFILNLLIIDLVKNLDKKLEPQHQNLFKYLKKEGYLSKEEDNGAFEKSITGDNKIFEFGLKYYFSVLLRISRKINEKNSINKFYLFNEIIKAYIKSDINKAKYVLEEFANTEALNEYLVYCINGDSVKDTLYIIMDSFKVITENNYNDDKTILYEFINTLVLFIAENFKKIYLEAVNVLFIQLISIDKKFIPYLKKKNLDKWVMSFYRRSDDDNEKPYPIKEIINERTFPKLNSNHHILCEKQKIPGDSENKNDTNEDIDTFENHFMQKIKNFTGNYNLINELNRQFN